MRISDADARLLWKFSGFEARSPYPGRSHALWRMIGPGWRRLSRPSLLLVLLLSALRRFAAPPALARVLATHAPADPLLVLCPLARAPNAPATWRAVTAMRRGEARASS
jgi:hypothetical protein